jgi:predicted dehydrogenase/GT2 family glycosyltransferase
LELFREWGLDLIRVGIVGIGFGQQVHVPAFRLDPRCEVVALCSKALERTQAVANRLEIPKSYGDWREMIFDPDIDAISIATPPIVQPAIALATLLHRKHIFCEKPLAATSEAAVDVLMAARKSGLAHMIDFEFPVIEEWQQAKVLLKSGALGRVQNVLVSWQVETYANRLRLKSWKTDIKAGGGALNSFVSHIFYYLEWLLDPIRRLKAHLWYGDTDDQLSADKAANLWAELADGTPVSISVCSNSFLGTGHRVEIYGDRGSLILVNPGSDYVNGFELFHGTRESKSLKRILVDDDRINQDDGRVVMVGRLVKRFLDWVQDGIPGTPTIEHGYRVQTLIDAARESHRKGIWLDVLICGCWETPEYLMLDIVIPVYNEGENIIAVLDSLTASVQTPFRVLICYDRDTDNTLPVLHTYKDKTFDLVLVKNRGIGAHGAVISGFKASAAPAVVVFPADDTYNAGILDQMFQKFAEEGSDIVAASRFMKGGRMEGCRWQKALPVRLAGFTLYHLARLSTHDASNGFRLFSRRVLDAIEIESSIGFTYSIELLVKCHRLGWKVSEVPALWFERKDGSSRFQVAKWLSAYLRWYCYAFMTTYLRRKPNTVRLNGDLM